MQNQITIRECVTPEAQERFWNYLREYFIRDIYPGEDHYEPCPEEYRKTIQALHDREENPMHYLLFCKNGQDIGLALTVLYQTEDGKQFILEFCVFPEFRGNGNGKECAAKLLQWGKQRGAKFAELNAGGDPRRSRFWNYSGFVPNGTDQWGEPLMLLPPQEQINVTVEVLTDTQDLWNLESGFLAEIGETPMDKTMQDNLTRAIADKQITFFVAKRLNRPIGLCSVSPCFSTFACKRYGVFDDFFIEPVFRKRGIARLLVSAARNWCKEQDFASLTVGCSTGDIAMYHSLGFDTTLGTMLAVTL